MKRSLDNKSGEPPQKKSKPNLKALWTHTNPVTGDQDDRLHRKDLDYRVISKHRRRQANRQKQKNNNNNSNSAKSKSKTKSKKDEELEDDDIKTDDLAKFHLKTQRFNGHVVVVTGAGKDNLGRAVALRFAQEGAKVVILDKQKFNDSIDSIVSKCKKDGIKAELSGHRCDITDETQVKQAIDLIIKDYGFIDAIVNCATTHGKDRGKITEEINMSDFNEVMDVNVNGTLNMCKVVLPYMVKENYGRIVNLASLWGKEGRAGHISFSAAKSAVIAATKTMAKEYAETGVTINCVAPAFLDDKAEKKSYQMTTKEMEKEIVIHRVGELEEIAGVIAFVASEENTYTTGFCYDISGGMASY